MERDFFISLAFATHRVADILPEEGNILHSCMKSSANRLLSDLLIFSENEPITKEQKRLVVPRVLQEIEILYGYFRQAREWNWIPSGNFLILQGEYNKVKEHVASFLREQVEEEKKDLLFLSKPVQITKPEAAMREEVPQAEASPARMVMPPRVFREVQQEQKKELVLPDRQKKILELLKSKEKVQIWELQSVLPDVTKRTLRRDMDDLLKSNLIERTGEWNTVSYQLKK